MVFLFKIRREAGDRNDHPLSNSEKAIHHLKVLCEDCCIDIRTPRVRKTHWQYLGSIITDYLIPSNQT